MFSEAGAYHFQLLVDNKLAGEFPLYFRSR